jgi:hypothetical protein
MPKIEKDLLKVKGSDGQWHYVPAVGGSVDTAPTWDAVQNKPFTTLGGGLEVDENGVLSVPKGGGGSPNAVQYVAQELTDEQKAQARENIGAKAATEKSAYIISKTRSYGYIHTNGMDFDRVYAQIQSGKVVMLLVDDSSTYYGVITPTNVADKTIMFYNIKDISPSDVGRRNKGIEYFGFTWHKGDDSLTEWFGDIPRVEVDSTLTKSGSAADAKTVGDALQNYVPAENYEENLQEIAQAIGTKLDKNQGAGNAGKILGIGADGIVVPQDKPTYTLTDADKTAVADAVVADGIAATLVDMPSGGGGAYKLLYSTTLTEAAVVSVDMTNEAAACGEYIISLAIPSGESVATYTRYTKIAGSDACATNIATVSNTYGTLQLINAKKIDDQKNLIEFRFVNTMSTTPTLNTAERTAWSVKRITVVPITYADVLFNSAIELPAGTIIRIGGK